jgi:nucleoside-diphosphate-sugar epimerase
MKVFVTGATGVVGPPAVRQLVADGHEVSAVARTPEKAAQVRALGATPVTVDLFDAAAVHDAVRGFDAIVNLATHIPRIAQMMLPGAWSENDRIRREVSRNLVDGALANDVGIYVQESIAFIYTDAGDRVIDEDSPIDVPPYAQSTLDAEAQAQRFAASGRTGIVLRFGMFHGSGSEQTQMQFRTARRDGVAVMFGRPDAYVPFIHTDDAGTAAAAALRAPSGIYNVVDNEPLTRRDFARALAAATGRRGLRLPPVAAAKLGGQKSDMLTRSERVSNARFREATGWSPRYRTAREALAAIGAQLPGEAGIGGVARGILALLAVNSLLVGFWAQLAPRRFYTGFPGFGRHWVSADGPFNEHLIRDVGGLNLALAVVLIAGVVLATRPAARVAALATLVYGVPHFTYHLAHMNLYSGSDQVASGAGLALSVVLPVVVLALCARTGVAEQSVVDITDEEKIPVAAR